MEWKRKEREWLEDALESWLEKSLITPEQAEALRKDAAKPQSPRIQLAHYFLIIATSCAACAILAIFIDEKALERLRRYFDLSYGTIAVICMAASAAAFWYAHRKAMPNKGLLLPVPGTILLLTTLLYLQKAFPLIIGDALLAGLCAAALGVVALAFRSQYIWLAFLLMLTFWFGILTKLYEHDYIFLGMNLPMRFVMFAGIMLGIQLLISQRNKVLGTDSFSLFTFHFALLLLLSALWVVSIFGNYGTLEEWSAVRQWSVLIYGMLFAAAAFATLLMGIKFHQPAARDYGILFLLLNLYTRYFEFFWDSMSKGLFFAILAVSFFGCARLLTRKKKAAGDITLPRINDQ